MTLAPLLGHAPPIIAVPLAALQARRHNIAAHRSAMVWIFTLALVVTGLFTFAAGRVMNKAMAAG